MYLWFEGEWMDGIKEPKNLIPLTKKNIDTGMGFERLLAVLNNVDTVHKTDTLNPIIEVVNKWSVKN
jgi:alanyl-tRNA synthetase